MVILATAGIIASSRRAGSSTGASLASPCSEPCSRMPSDWSCTGSSAVSPARPPPLDPWLAFWNAMPFLGVSFLARGHLATGRLRRITSAALIAIGLGAGFVGWDPPCSVGAGCPPGATGPPGHRSRGMAWRCLRPPGGSHRKRRGSPRLDRSCERGAVAQPLPAIARLLQLADRCRAQQLRCVVRRRAGRIPGRPDRLRPVQRGLAAPRQSRSAREGRERSALVGLSVGTDRAATKPRTRSGTSAGALTGRAPFGGAGMCETLRVSGHSGREVGSRRAPRC